MFKEEILVVRSYYDKAKCLSFDRNGRLTWTTNPSNYLAFDTEEEAVTYINSLEFPPPLEVATVSVTHFTCGSLQANLVN